MADSLFLVGVKDVRKHKGTEMQLVNPLRGGNTHMIKEWWRNGVNTTYTGCTIFKVTTANGTVRLALATGKSEGSEIRVDHDGDFNFTFSYINEIERAALYTDAMELIEHYVFPSIAGGPVMTVTPPGAADRPTGAPPLETTVDSVAFTPKTATATTGDSVTYTAVATGDATPYTYTWTVTNGTVTSGAGTAALTVNWDTAGGGSVAVVAGSTNANFDGDTKPDSLNVTVSDPAPPPPATGPADSVTLVGDVSTEGTGIYTDVATTSANGSGLTVDYGVIDGTVDNIDINQAGSGYQEGDSLTVVSDTGVTGTVSIASVLTTNVAQADVSHVVTASGGYYYIDGVQQAEVTANAGETIYFDLSDSSLSTHPFKIYTDSSKTTEVTVGVESDANGLIFTPPISGTFSYQCASHANMGGTITIS